MDSADGIVLRRSPAVLSAAPTGIVGALILCAAALVVAPGRIRMPPAPDSDDHRPTARPAGPGRPAVAAIAAALAAFLLFPDRWWVATGVGLLSGLVVQRRSPGRSARRRKADRAAVAVHAELFAACLDAGMAVAPALRAVSDAMRGPDVSDDQRAPGPKRLRGRASGDPMRVLGGSGTASPGPGRAEQETSGPLAVLDSVAAMLSLGADPQSAWRAADAVEELAPLAAAARRSAAGGGGLAEAVRGHAAVLRADDAATDLRAAGRAGVLMTAPLGVCFLPAFLCLGLAPVVVGLLGQLDIF